MECIKCPYYDYGLGGQYCNKVGGKIILYGYCEDAYSEIIKYKNTSKKKRRNKRERDQKYKKHLKFLAENIQHYPSPVIYINEIYAKGEWYVEAPKPYYKRLYNRKGGIHRSSTYYKKMSNKKIRRFKGDLPKKGNLGHKLYDYKREIY